MEPAIRRVAGVKSTQTVEREAASQRIEIAPAPRPAPAKSKVVVEA
jgi:hypothetical protein